MKFVLFVTDSAVILDTTIKDYLAVTERLSPTSERDNLFFMGDLYSVAQTPMLRAVSVLKGERKSP